ncbi:MAG: hypothetical protein ACP5I4_00070 [Oceanipulchritudo sp.]
MAVLSKSKKAPQRLWRPDFRTAETLPDTKVIRTGFLLNFIAVALAALGICLYGVREYQLQSLMRSVDTLEKQVSESTSRNRIILDENKRFLQSAKVVEEAVAFDHEVVSCHTFITELAGILPEGMEILSIEMSSTTEVAGKGGLPPFAVQLTGVVLQPAPATPAQILNSFQEKIKAIPCISGKETGMETTRFSRNNNTGNFDFTLIVKIPADKAPSL